ncbi:GDSL esterase/lipase 7-like [Juglans microcarpa x Juglans regia]|uniref:GDSL esterase/lipase 7-like n=1 Tax=Juglans microcarpa x Juglans regia TaxID=2249226 RepID=UPI001B7F5199|nr:GDSL esterase/lipase 7-like [Juglans microcarpa x Juglans regia]
MSTIMIISMSFIFFLHVLPAAMIQSLPLAPALYVFGDSLFDSGNNNLLPTVAKADYLPYGINFAKGVTGRFTNGKTIADFIAEFLGLPYSPPFMSIRRTTPLTGLNYASGSCGILPETGNLYGKCLNLNEQINLFERTVKSGLERHACMQYFNMSSNELSDYLSKSIFIFSVGSNDYLNNYLEPNVYDTSKRYPPQPFAQFLVDTLGKVFQRLYNLGGRKIIMFEIGPIGCIPSITRKKKHNAGQCVEETNQIVSFFNQRLPAFLNNLTSTLHGSTFILAQANFLGYDAIINPSKYGLEDSNSPCCTTWANGTSGCIPFITPCLHAYKNFFWDAFHLTEAAYSLIATRCFNDSICSPFNIKELVRM